MDWTTFFLALLCIPPYTSGFGGISKSTISYTLWLFNIAMENPKNKWRFRSLGKSSISIGHLYHGYVSHNLYHTWWLIPLSKWVITPVISGLTLLIPFITGVITHLLSGMSHQVDYIFQLKSCPASCRWCVFVAGHWGRSSSWYGIMAPTWANFWLVSGHMGSTTA